MPIKLLPFDYAVRNLGRSPARLAQIVAGSALVVGLVITASAFVRGLTGSLTNSAGARNVILLGAGSEESVERSEVPASAASLVAASIPGIRSRLGQAYVSPEVHVALPVRLEREDAAGPLVLVRGVTHTAPLVHARFQLLEGRMPRRAHNEVIMGRYAHRRLGLSGPVPVGSRVWIDEASWTVVGVFGAAGTTLDAEIWAPLTDLRDSTRRETDSCVVVTLDTGEFADVDTFCKLRPDLELTAIEETEYYGSLVAFFAPMRAVAWATALLIGLAGILGGLNTLYAAFATRSRELGTLQAMGFRRVAVLVSLIQESAVASAAGALIACVAALLTIDRLAVPFSTGVVAMRIDGAPVLLGLVVGLGIGVAGAIPPARRALSVPIAEALKAV